MRTWIVEGGKKIFGKIKCFGSKNFSNKAIIAALLSNEESCLENIPPIGETEIIIGMIKNIGANIRYSGDFLFINPSIDCNFVRYPDSRTNRIPILILGCLIHKFNEVFVPSVGGDAIGKRPIDIHIDLFEKFGCKFQESSSGYLVSRDRDIHGTEITLKYPSVGATENALFLSVLAKGRSIISNIAIEPEIISLIEMLKKMGARISFRSQRSIIVDGVQELSGVKFKIIGDRLEAASWASLAAATDGEIEVTNCDSSLLRPFIDKFEEAGGICKSTGNSSLLFSRSRNLTPIDIVTDVYPGFSTDLHQPISLFLSRIKEGVSRIHDTVYENRMQYLVTLNNKMNMNANVIKCCDKECRFFRKEEFDTAEIRYSKLITKNQELQIPDIRAGLALLIATIVADGRTSLSNIEIVERGYGNIIDKLSETNVNIYESYSDESHVSRLQMSM